MVLANSWQGNLNLVYVSDKQTTRVQNSYSRAPLKIQRPFYPENPQICHSVILHTAGGMVGGDRLIESIEMKEHSHALITTAAATKVYRTLGELATQTVTLKLEQGACLEWLPQETIIFNQARYRQTLKVELAPDAHWLGWEITRLGRTARGEQFTTGEWRAHTEVWRGGQPLWIERQYLEGSPEMVASPQGLNKQSVVGTLLGIGLPISLETIQKMRSLWQKNQYQGQTGVTQTLGQGVLCRYRGSSTREVRHWFTEVWHLWRHSLGQLPPVQPRIWFC